MIWFSTTKDEMLFKIHKIIWDALLDYGRAAWNRCMRLIRKTSRTKKNFSRSLIDTELFVLEEVALLGGVMMGPKGASSIKHLGMRWHSSHYEGLLF
jgi:hypothetical protein